MVDFSDVMRFAETHRACGSVAPAVTPQPSGGYLLTLTCACGAFLDRRVTADEATHAPFLAGVPPSAPPPRPVVAAPTAPRKPDPPRLTPSPELERAMREALEAEEAAAAATPAPAARRAPATPAAPPTDTRDRKAPSPELEEVLRRAVAASAAELEPRKPASAKRAAGPARTANVAETVRAALREQERLRDDLTKAAAPDRPRSRTMWLGLAALVVLAGTGAVLYVGNAPEPESPVAAASTPSPDPGAAAAQNMAGTFGNAVRVLRRVQATSGPTTSLPSYEAHVSVAQTVVGRYLDSDAPPDVKRDARAILDLHLLAVAAWRLRAVDTPQAWEPVSRSPALDLCAPVKNVAYVAERAGQNNAQARGRAIAGAIPLLWECASTRLAQLNAAR